MSRKREPTIDNDNPEWTEADFARATPAAQALSPEVLANFPKTRGRPKVPTPKRPVTLRLDSDVVEHLRARGKGWQTQVNAALSGLIADGKL